MAAMLQLKAKFSTQNNRPQMFHCSKREHRRVATSLIEDFLFCQQYRFDRQAYVLLICTWHWKALGTHPQQSLSRSSILIGHQAETSESGEALLSTHIICTIPRGKPTKNTRKNLEKSKGKQTMQVECCYSWHTHTQTHTRTANCLKVTVSPNTCAPHIHTHTHSQI